MASEGIKQKRKENTSLILMDPAVEEEKSDSKESVQLISRFPGFRTVGSHLAKKQSCSTLQGLRVGTGFMEFRQLREVGVFSYLI